MSYNVYEDLVSLGLTSDKTAQLFAEQTRDRSSVKVWRDRASGVIFIKDFYVGDEAYQAEDSELCSSNGIKRTSYEDAIDCARRVNNFRSMYHGKTVCEFGFGKGEFMEAVAPFCRTINGVELNTDHLARISKKGFAVAQDLNQFNKREYDTIFLFHTFEHLPDPLNKLNQIRKKLKPGGKIIIEVPHARDFLLRDDFDCDAFKSHTLWSQHLILHTRQSLSVMLAACSFKDILVEGIQRYPLSNHLQWLAKGTPGGHLSNFSSVDNELLSAAYEMALAKNDATDTIIATATVEQF